MSSSDDKDISWFAGTFSLLDNAWDWLRENTSEILKSFFEVVVTICFTFVPFIFLSIKWAEAEGSNSVNALWGSFFGYWQSGEIALPILGLCGAVAALLTLNKGYFHWWIHALVIFFILVFTLGVGAALIGTDGFDQSLNSELIVIGFGGYAFLAFLWFLLSARVRVIVPGARDSDSSALKILDSARKIRENAGRHND